jgi:hypothetical protein
MADLIKVTGLWKSEDKNGNMVLSGNLSGTARVVIFTNTYKEENERGPDFEMYIGKKEPKEE